MDQVFITSAAVSNYEGMYALIADDGRVYLGRDSISSRKINPMAPCN